MQSVLDLFKSLQCISPTHCFRTAVLVHDGVLINGISEERFSNTVAALTFVEADRPRADNRTWLKNVVVSNVIMSYRIQRLNCRLDDACFAC